MHGDIDFGVKGIHHEPVARVNDVFVQHINVGEVFVNGRPAAQLFDEFVLMFKIQVNAFLYVRHFQNFFGIVIAAQVNHVHHQLII